MGIQLTDGHITLRQFDLADAPYHLAHEDEEIEKWVSGGKSTPESVKAWIEKNAQHWENNGPVFNFAVTDSNGVLIGMVEANSDQTVIPELQDSDANISYALFADARGKGYATRAVTLMMTFLKNKHFKRAIIRVDAKNEPSQGIPQRLGFEQISSKNAKEGDLITFAKILEQVKI